MQSNEQIKYTEDGRAVEVLEEVKSGFLVRKYFEFDSEDDYHPVGDAFLVHKVYDKAPTEKLDKRLAGIQADIDRLNDERFKLVSDLNSLRGSSKDRLARYAQYDQLKTLDRFLDKAITHYVEDSWQGIRIVEFKNSDDECDRGNLRLLSLYGKTNGDLEWHLNKYSDGSGSWSTVIPCCSYEEARAEAAKMVATRIEKSGLSESLIDRAREFGYSIPNEQIDALKSVMDSRYTKRIEEIESQLAKAKEERESSLSKLYEVSAESIQKATLTSNTDSNVE